MLISYELNYLGVGKMLQQDTPGRHGVEARDVVKVYPGGLRALDGVSLAVAPGTVFGLLGPNGAGKTTMVRILSTLSLPTSGTVSVAGHDAVRHPDRVRRAIGVVGQRSAVDPAATGRENLRLHAHLHNLESREVTRRSEALLERFDLRDAAGVMMELNACRKANPDAYIKLNAFDSTRGFETVRMSFIVQRPKVEPHIAMTRTDVRGRTVNYTLTPVR